MDEIVVACPPYEMPEWFDGDVAVDPAGAPESSAPPFGADVETGSAMLFQYVSTPPPIPRVMPVNGRTMAASIVICEQR
jgi:hypothetical protein